MRFSALAVVDFDKPRSLGERCLITATCWNLTQGRIRAGPNIGGPITVTSMDLCRAECDSAVCLAVAYRSDLDLCYLRSAVGAWETHKWHIRLLRENALRCW